MTPSRMRRTRPLCFAGLLVICAHQICGATPPETAARHEPACPQVTVTAPPAHLGLSAAYTQYVDAGGVPIVARAGVPTEAFREIGRASCRERV